MSMPTPVSTPGRENKLGPGHRESRETGRPVDRTGGMENAHETMVGD